MSFNRERRSAFNKSFSELLENSFKNINEKDKRGNTILYLAAEFSSYKTVKLLIEKGADINIESNDGEVALHQAARARRARNVKALIEAGAEVDYTDHNGCTPLHYASRLSLILKEGEGNAKGTVEELIKAGANVNAVNRFGASPLFYARKEPELEKLIKNHGGKVIDKIGMQFKKIINYFDEYLDKMRPSMEELCRRANGSKYH